MKRKLLWSEQGRQNLHDIDVFLSSKDPLFANKKVRRLINRAEQLVHMPFLGKRQESKKYEVRQLLVDEFWLIYAVSEAQIRVLRVLHERQDNQLMVLLELNSKAIEYFGAWFALGNRP